MHFSGSARQIRIGKNGHRRRRIASRVRSRHARNARRNRVHDHRATEFVAPTWGSPDCAGRGGIDQQSLTDVKVAIRRLLNCSARLRKRFWAWIDIE